MTGLELGPRAVRRLEIQQACARDSAQALALECKASAWARLHYGWLFHWLELDDGPRGVSWLGNGHESQYRPWLECSWIRYGLGLKHEVEP
jgi:hypothetical protein